MNGGWPRVPPARDRCQRTQSLLGPASRVRQESPPRSAEETIPQELERVDGPTAAGEQHRGEQAVRHQPSWVGGGKVLGWSHRVVSPEFESKVEGNVPQCKSDKLVKEVHGL